MADKKTIEKLVANCTFEPNSGCWLWLGAVNDSGYGSMWNDKKAIGAHRLMWIALHGPIPFTIFVCHRCDVRSCINPEHLFLGTNQDNIQDMLIKNRSSFGERSGKAILTESEVIEIWDLFKSGKGQVSIAKRYGVSPGAIANITAGRNWKHLRLLEQKP
ncbi:MAG: HNH endonuclease [Gammaproteobacteria bacterium]